MTKFQDLLTDRVSLESAGFITPTPPDFEIMHDGAGGVTIESSAKFPDKKVLEWIAEQKGGSWKMVEWKLTVDGKEMTYPNPHPNNRGLWVYLVRKV